jgi:hypothetical protein
VMNSSSAPALASLIDEPGRIPYFSTQSNTSESGFLIQFSYPAVPANHRLVVTHIAGFYRLTGTPAWTSLSLYSGTTNNLVTNFFTPSANATVKFDTPVNAYIDAGQTPITVAEVETAPFFTGFAFSALSGYMIDCSAAPCAAIAQ